APIVKWASAHWRMQISKREFTFFRGKIAGRDPPSGNRRALAIIFAGRGPARQPEGVSVTHYDARNRVTDSVAPDRDGDGQAGRPNGPKTPQPTTYLYDADGNVTRMIDPADNETDYLYDGLDRLTSQTNHAFLNLNQTDVSVNRAYEYDADGNLTAAKDRND